MKVKPFLRWLRGTVPPIRPDDQAIARQAYADYLRAQIIGYVPDRAQDLLEALKTDDKAGIARTSATFAELMGVETRLAGALDDDLVRRTYWIVRERFNRVGSAAAVAEHSKWAPPGLVEAADKVPLMPMPAPEDDEDDDDAKATPSKSRKAPQDEENTERTAPVPGDPGKAPSSPAPTEETATPRPEEK